MLDDYYGAIRDQLDRLIRDVPKPNILTLGMTGAGKSSLINQVFGDAVAVTGTGKPVTQGITFYDSATHGVGIFDSRGYEFGPKGEESYFQETVNFATASSASGRGVHMAWYCIPAESERIHPIDDRTIKGFNQIGVPTAIVITKTDQLSLVKNARFAKTVEERFGTYTPIFRTSIVLPGDKPEIQRLCSWSCNTLPEALRLGFTRAQRSVLEAKKEQAIKVVQTFQAEMSNQGFALFKASDERMLKEGIFRMSARILYLYDMEEIRHSLSGVGDLIDQGDQMVAFIATLVEKTAEFIGYLIDESHGREAGRWIGRVLANFSRSITSQQIVEAVGLSIVQICSNLADQAIASRGAVSPIVQAQIEQQFEEDIRKRLEGC